MEACKNIPLVQLNTYIFKTPKNQGVDDPLQGKDCIQSASQQRGGRQTSFGEFLTGRRQKEGGTHTFLYIPLFCGYSTPRTGPCASGTVPPRGTDTHSISTAAILCVSVPRGGTVPLAHGPVRGVLRQQLRHRVVRPRDAHSWRRGAAGAPMAIATARVGSRGADSGRTGGQQRTLHSSGTCSSGSVVRRRVQVRCVERGGRRGRRKPDAQPPHRGGERPRI